MPLRVGPFGFPYGQSFGPPSAPSSTSCKYFHQNLTKHYKYHTNKQKWNKRKFLKRASFYFCYKKSKSCKNTRYTKSCQCPQKISNSHSAENRKLYISKTQLLISTNFMRKKKNNKKTCTGN